MFRGDGGERHAKRHLAPKCGPVRKSVEFGPVELDGLVPRYVQISIEIDGRTLRRIVPREG